MSNLLTLVLSLSLSGTVLAALLFAAKPLIRHRLSKTVQYGMWIIVLLRLVLPFSSESSLMNQLFYGNGTVFYSARRTAGVDPIGTNAGNTGYQDLQNDGDGAVFDSSHDGKLTVGQAENSNPIDKAEQSAAGRLTGELNGKQDATGEANREPVGRAGSFIIPVLFAVWLLGAILVFASNLKGYLCFLRELKKTNRVADGEEREVPDALLQYKRAAVWRKVFIVRNPYIAAPMTIGVFRPCIVLPDRTFAANQLQYILLHELVHIRRFDVAVKWITMVASSVHWFNPFLYAVRKEVNRACELACDEAVVRNFTNREKQEYGDTLLTVVSEERYPLGVLQATMNEDKKTLKDRLTAIMKYQKKSRAVMGLSVALLLLLVFGALALGGVGIGTPRPPQMYVSTERKGFGEALTGNYQWKNGVSYIYADAGHPVDLAYKPENIISVSAGEQLIISPRLRKIDRKYAFTAGQIQVYKNGEPYFFPMDEPVYGMDSLYLHAPQEKGVYIYSLLLDFGGRGTAGYSFMVYADTPYYDLEAIAEHRTPYVGDVSKVSAIVGCLPVPDNRLLQKYIFLETSGKQYGLTVYYEPGSGLGKRMDLPVQDRAMEEVFHKNALVLFCMIDNLDQVTISFRDTPSGGNLDPSAYKTIYQFHRADFEEEHGSLSMLRNPGLLREKLDNWTAEPNASSESSDEGNRVRQESMIAEWTGGIQISTNDI